MRSYLPEFDLVTPPTMPQALGLLASGEGWRPIAGGTDLMVLMNAGKLDHSRLVAVDRFPELRGIAETESHISIGAATTFTEIREHAALREHFPLLPQAASWSGGVANQNRGTLGGNIANASPAADSLPALLVYEAELLLVSVSGSRTIPYRNFHTGYKQMALNADELIAQIHLLKPSGRTVHHGRKVGTRKAQAISKVCIAATGNTGERRFRLAFGSVAPIPLRCVRTEELLTNDKLTSALIREAERVLSSEISPITDIRSTSGYRTTVACNLLREFLELLL